MKINLITPSLPYPIDRDGTTIIVSNYAMQLSKKHQISITYIDKNIDDKAVQKKAEKFWTNWGIELRIFDISNIDRFMLEPLPRTCAKLGRIKDIPISMKISDYQVIFRSDLILALSRVKSKFQGKVIYFPIDLFSRLYASYYNEEDSFIKKLYYLSQIILWRLWENWLFKLEIFTFFVSSADAKELKNRLKNSSKIITTKNGVYFEAPVAPSDRIQGNTIRIGFSGDFSYKPNKQGAALLIDTVIPRLMLSNVKDIEFYFIGRNPHISVGERKLANGIKLIITGEVDDIFNNICNLDLYVSPLITGAGMKNKILSVMAAGVPFCATQKSVEGIDDLVDGKHFISLPENDTSVWPDLMRQAYQNKDFMESSPILNKKLASSVYSWSSVVSFFEEVALND